MSGLATRRVTLPDGSVWTMAELPANRQTGKLLTRITTLAEGDPGAALDALLDAAKASLLVHHDAADVDDLVESGCLTMQILRDCAQLWFAGLTGTEEQPPAGDAFLDQRGGVAEAEDPVLPRVGDPTVGV